MPESAVELLRRGMEAVSQRNNVEAYLLFSRAAELEPENVEVLLWKAGYSDDPWEAQAILEHVLELDPGNSRACAGLEWVKAKLVAQPQLKAAVPPRTGPDEITIEPWSRTRSRAARRASRHMKMTQGPLMVGVLFAVALISLGTLLLVTNAGNDEGSRLTPVLAAVETATPEPPLTVTTEAADTPVPTEAETPTFTPAPPSPSVPPTEAATAAPTEPPAEPASPTPEPARPMATATPQPAEPTVAPTSAEPPAEPTVAEPPAEPTAPPPAATEEAPTPVPPTPEPTSGGDVLIPD